MAGDAGEGAVAGPIESAILGDEVLEARTSYLTSAYAECPAIEEIVYYVGQERKSNEEFTKEQLKGLVCGEISTSNLFTILNLAREHGPLYDSTGIFIDCGSGTGKCVIGASLFHTFNKCVGIELMSKMDEVAQQAITAFSAAKTSEENPWPEDVPKTAEVSCIKGNIVDELGGLIGEEQCTILAVATCFDDSVMKGICESASKAPLGSLLITVTKAAPDIELWEPVHIQDMEFPWGLGTLFIQAKIGMPPEEA